MRMYVRVTAASSLEIVYLEIGGPAEIHSFSSLLAKTASESMAACNHCSFSGRYRKPNKSLFPPASSISFFSSTLFSIFYFSACLSVCASHKNHNLIIYRSPYLSPSLVSLFVLLFLLTFQCLSLT